MLDVISRTGGVEKTAGKVTRNAEMETHGATREVR